MKAMVLAAGFGTRLRPLTLRRPKPLVPFGDGHALGRAVAMLRHAGASRVVVNAHHLAHQVVRWAESQSNVGASVEQSILGTAGGVAAAAGLLGPGDVVVMNGDIMAQLDFDALVRASASEVRPLAVLGLGPQLPAGQGTVGLSDSGQIVRLRDYRGSEPESRSGDFVGSQWIAGEARHRLPQQGCLVGDFYMPLLRQGCRLATTPICTGFFDVGTLGDYLKAHQSWLGERMSWCGENASIGREVVLRKSVVGAAATVAGQGDLEGCIVWPGAEAIAPLRNCIVMDDGTVVSVPPPSSKGES